MSSSTSAVPMDQQDPNAGSKTGSGEEGAAASKKRKLDETSGPTATGDGNDPLMGSSVTTTLKKGGESKATNVFKQEHRVSR